MRQEIEIEFKNMLTKEEFHRLCDSFAVTNFTEQVNHYFETPSFSLKEKGAALRIREKNGIHTITLKQPAVTGLLETHQTVTKQEAEWMMRTGTMVPGAVYDQLLSLHVPVQQLNYYGSLTTQRAELLYENGTLVFDHSFYFHHDDYELEYEVQDEETGRKSFLHLLGQYNIPVRPTKNKVQRFFLAKQSASQ